MKIERILLICIGAVLGLIICGSVIGIANKKSTTPEVLISKGKAENLAAPADSDIIAYYQVGAIRIVTLPDKKSETGNGMIVNPWLAYPEGDTVFYEEIARKRGFIKGIFSKYFSDHSRTEILSFGEEKIKADLLSEINSQLVLGQISDIYFTDFIFFD